MATNIKALTVALHDKLATIPLHQPIHYRYVGMVEQPEVYALMGAPPWKDFPNPGPLQQYINTDSTSSKHWDAEAIHAAKKNVWDSQFNIKWAIINAMNEAILCQYKLAEGYCIGA